MVTLLCVISILSGYKLMLETPHRSDISSVKMDSTPDHDLVLKYQYRMNGCTENICCIQCHSSIWQQYSNQKYSATLQQCYNSIVMNTVVHRQFFIHPIKLVIVWQGLLFLQYIVKRVTELIGIPTKTGYIKTNKILYYTFLALICAQGHCQVLTSYKLFLLLCLLVLISAILLATSQLWLIIFT